MMSARPQVGIERLTAVRRMSNEQRESMNCKSCRKRKIKCNRLRPTCEACQVFQCPCIYDAVPKKRGPKTDVLEALLKRVDGLEKQLKTDQTTTPPIEGEERKVASDSRLNSPHVDPHEFGSEAAVYSPPPSEPSPRPVQGDALLDTYFVRCHSKPFYILDEPTVRYRIQKNQIPSFLLHAIYAISSSYAGHPNGFEAAALQCSEYAFRSRSELDIDSPTIESLQALLLLSLAFTACGDGRKSYMMLVSAIGQATALELHREPPVLAQLQAPELELRRHLFWTIYMMDRFSACGSKRPALIADESIVLRLPSWSNTNSILIEGDYFQVGSNLQYHPSTGKKCQGSNGMLIDIVRVLGITNRYLAVGGVKGDSHFPWHSLSNLSKIRQELDIWASGTQEVFSSVDVLLGQPDSTALVLSKLIYHLIHCLIYRPFLPIDLAELAGTGQHQSWQIEATNLCFLHANAVAELVELGKQAPTISYPAFTAYTIFTAGTVHIHGTHYATVSTTLSSPQVFTKSSSLLSLETNQLSELRHIWTSVQQQRDTLQQIYNAHSEMVKSISASGRYASAFQLEDFFERYGDLGLQLDVNMSFAELNISTISESYPYVPSDPISTSSLTRKRNGSLAGSSGRRKHLNLKIAHQNQTRSMPSQSTPFTPQTASSDTIAYMHSQQDGSGFHSTSFGDTINVQPYTPGSTMTPYTTAPFSPPYSYGSIQVQPQHNAGRTNPTPLQTPGLQVPAHHASQQLPPPMHGESYDPMFSMGGFSHNQSYANSLSGDLAGTGVRTPGGGMAGPGEEERDPFLTLLEQLAENEGADEGFYMGVPNG